MLSCRSEAECRHGARSAVGGQATARRGAARRGEAYVGPLCRYNCGCFFDERS